MFTPMDPSLPGDAPITLVIKAPNQRMADQTVECMLGWTIRKLKQHLETVYPSKPKHNEQRLIYSGKLLQDHLTLKEILRQYEGCEEPNKHTVHLVCSASTCSESSNKSGSNTKSASPEPRSSQSETQPVSSVSASPSLSQQTSTVTQVNGAVNQADGLRYRGIPSTAHTTASAHVYNPAMMYAPGTAQHTGLLGGYPAGVATQSGYMAGYTPEQYAVMVQQQQVYSQYMMQYMQYYQSMYYPGQAFNPYMMAAASTLTQQQTPTASSNIQQQQEQLQQQPQQAAPAENRPNNNNMPRMNAQGGVEPDDDDDEPRDWLHHIYSFMRCLTFLGILFFYSNLTRFLLVSSGTVAIYLLQKIRRYMQRVQQAQEQERRQQEEQQQQNQAEPQQNIPEQNDPNSSNRDEQRQEQEAERNINGDAQNNTDGTREAIPPAAVGQVEGQEVRPDEEGHWVVRTFVFVCMTVQAFFTSLLPTPPELLEAN